MAFRGVTQLQDRKKKEKKTTQCQHVCGSSSPEGIGIYLPVAGGSYIASSCVMMITAATAVFTLTV